MRLSSVKSYFSLRSIRGQLLAFSVGLFGLTLLGFSAFLYQTFTTLRASEFDADLLNYSVDVAYALDVDLFGQISLSNKFHSQSEKLFPFEMGETLVQLRTREGMLIARSNRLRNTVLPLTRSSLELLQNGESEYRTIATHEAVKLGLHDQEYRLLNYYFEKKPGDAIILQVAAPTRILDHERHLLLTFFSVSIPLVLLLSIFGGIYLSRKALAPVTAIIDKTKRLSADKLTERLPVPSNVDEIHELALTLNGLLDRLEESFRSQQTFVSDASHQLKTPLAILRGEIDLMRSRPRSPEEMNQFLQSASEEVGYLTRMIEDLLVLARIDAGSRSLSLSRFRLDETLCDVVARLNRLAAPKRVDLMLELPEDLKDAEIQGDADLIRSLFESIIENAVKYSQDCGGRVQISLKETQQTVDVSVTDHGVGVSKEDLPKIFDRFYRSDRTSHHHPGSGLGLAIAKRIIEVHQAGIQAESEPGSGTRVQVSLKKSLL